MACDTTAAIALGVRLYPPGIAQCGSYQTAPKKSMPTLFPDALTRGEMYDVLALSELVTLLLTRERAVIASIQSKPPSRSDLHVTTAEVYQPK